MAITLNTNIDSQKALSQLQKSQEGLSESLNRIATGRRINRASDDPSGMIIANSLGFQARGMGQAIRNTHDANAIAQVADGALGEATGILDNIREKAIQAANGSHSADSRAALQADIDKSLQALGDLSQDTSFNGQKLLSGEFSNKVFQTGGGQGENVTLSIPSVDPSVLGGEHEGGSLAGIDVTTQEGAQAAIAITDAALEQVGNARSDIGASQNQLESTINNLSTSRISAFNSQSQVQDVDFAEEAMNLTKMENLTKARTFALAQSNTAGRNALSVLGLGADK
ncbi:flagellin [Desulfobacter latus]|uniref:Flagellin n=1 Tax=Desulfobacter latus TaxID=2292 RepID=A0A850TDF7_9BACT|nr:flagellin [Desulfobacter latus]NWH05466.1 flagellin FliC [Desulfobacter latus]